MNMVLSSILHKIDVAEWNGDRGLGSMFSASSYEFSPGVSYSPIVIRPKKKNGYVPHNNGTLPAEKT